MEAFRFFDLVYFVSNEEISFPLFPLKDCPVFYANLTETSRISGILSGVLVGGLLVSVFMLGLLLSLCVVCSVTRAPLRSHGDVWYDALCLQKVSIANGCLLSNL